MNRLVCFGLLGILIAVAGCEPQSQQQPAPTLPPQFVWGDIVVPNGGNRVGIVRSIHNSPNWKHTVIFQGGTEISYLESQMTLVQHFDWSQSIPQHILDRWEAEPIEPAPLPPPLQAEVDEMTKFP